MKKVFISQPMRGKTTEEIMSVRLKAIESAERLLGEKVEAVDSYFGTSDLTHALEYLGESIKRMAQADAVFFAKGWENARGCRIENQCAIDYGITVIEDYGSF